MSFSESSSFSTLILFGKLLKTIFLGTLRDREVEVLWENSRFAVTNTLLALTIFREELGIQEAVLFVMLIFSKIFHWVSKKRVEFMEGQEDVVWRDHFRIVTLKGTLLATDLAVVAVAAAVSEAAAGQRRPGTAAESGMRWRSGG